jgi:ribosomal protein S18 acetylase RimI-like enzyme
MDTEARLIEPICTFEDHPGYRVFRSEKFPNFYGGNGIDIDDPGGVSLAGWEEIFHRHFDPARYVHTTFHFPDKPAFAPLIGEARLARYNVVERTAYMFLDHTRECRDAPAGYEIRRVESEEEWEMMARFAEASYVDGDWYDPAAKGPDRLFEKRRFTSEAIGIEWFYIARVGHSEMLAQLGIFSHGGICRLQDVETAAAHRRKGLATALVGFAARHAIETLGMGGLALCADTDYHAIDLYRRLGFVECGESVELMKYPVRNPLHLDVEGGS